MLFQSFPNLFVGAKLKLFAEDSNFLLQTFSSFITVFLERSFFEKDNFFLHKRRYRHRNTLCLVRNSNFVQKTLNLFLLTFPSFITLFPEYSFYEIVNFFHNRSCRLEPPLVGMELKLFAQDS